MLFLDLKTMKQDLQTAFILGIERVAAWSDLLDEINVFPIADGDTGRNLIASLTPLRQLNGDRDDTIHQLLMAARGNSGNIATRFFSGLLTADSLELLPQAAKMGRDSAWEAVHNPVPGTMLTVFDALVEFLENEDIENKEGSISKIIDHLENAVRSTPNLLPLLKQAGVVDSGALGMYVFLEGFFKSMIDKIDDFVPITTRFKGMLQVASSFKEDEEEGHCVDTVVRLKDQQNGKIELSSKLGDCAVVIPHKDYLKVHLHTKNKDALKKKMESLGEIVQWTDDNLAEQVENFKKHHDRHAIHIMTDAAGSLTREDARNLGITLLDSYIIAESKSLPETLFSPSELYRSMKNGVKVSTSQASTFERHQYYQRVLDQYGKVLYLCVGSVFTGNYQVAMDWKKKNDPDGKLTVIDTTAASGRLGSIAMATAKYRDQEKEPDAIIAFARRAIEKCEEYVFLDKLQYLANGGRLSKTSAFFGDTFRIKPIVSPTAEGAQKVGTARNQKGQITFAMEKIQESLDKGSSPFIMLEYSDNAAWVNDVIKKKIENLYPAAEIVLQPLSLTSGVHMGPGTWALAFIPEQV